MKWWFVVLFFLVNNSYAQSIDYSKNKNDYQKYSYKSPSQSTNKEPNYFSNDLTFPEKIKQDPNVSCWDKAGLVYNLDPWLLVAVANVESNFKSNAISKNKNNSYDIGLMQINTYWLPTLKKYGINVNHLLDPCVSIFVGAWIMAQNIKHYGYNLEGIGAYNSTQSLQRKKYAIKVYLTYKNITKNYVSLN